MDKTIWRLFGTILGGSLGLVGVAVFSGIPELIIAGCALATTVSFYCIQKGSPAFWRWTLLSFLIVVLYTINFPQDSFILAIYRISGVGLGLITVLLTHSVVPAKDSQSEFSATYRAMAQTLSGITENVIMRTKGEEPGQPPNILNLHNQINALKGVCKILAKKDLNRGDGYNAFARDMGVLGQRICLLLNSSTLMPEDIEACRPHLHNIQKHLKAMAAGTEIPEVNLSDTESSEQCQLFEIISNIETTPARVSDFAMGNMPYEESTVSTDFPAIDEGDLLGGEGLRVYKALLGGLSVGLAILLWRIIGWPAGSAFTLIVMFYTLFATNPPYMNLKTTLVLFTVSFMGCGIMSLVILPQVTDFESFFIAISSFYCLLALLIESENPRLRGFATLVAVLVNSTVNGYSVHWYAFNVYTMIGIAMFGGLLVSTVMIRIFLPFSPQDVFDIHHKKLLDALSNVRLQAAHSNSMPHFQATELNARAIALLDWGGRLPKPKSDSERTQREQLLLNVFCLQGTLQLKGLNLSYFNELRMVLCSNLFDQNSEGSKKIAMA